MGRPKLVVAEEWSEGASSPVRNTSHKYLKFINSGVFSEEARHFLRYGYYTNAPYGSKDWVEYWDEQEKRCLEGYSVGGVRVTGRHYFFLNFTLIKARPVDPVTGMERDQKKIITFPRFLDHQYYLFLELENCFAEGPHVGKPLQGIVIAKARRKGITFVNSGGVINYNYNFVPASHTVIAAYEAVHYGTLLNGVHFGLNHINKNTDWAKRRQKINRRDHFRASFSYTDDLGVEIEDGFMSEVQAKSFKDDPFKAIGDSVWCMCWEEAGRFKGLLDAYTIAEPTFRDGDIMTGVPIIFGTGGNVETGGRDLEELFYNPSAYGLKSYSNIYDDNASGDCGWFIDDMWYLPGMHKTKHVLVDAQGNSYRDLAEDVIDEKRKIRERGSRAQYRRFVTQQCKSPKEAFLRIDTSPFDTLRAQMRVSTILTNRSIYLDSIYLANLVADPETGTIKYEYDPSGIPLRDFPIKDWGNIEGCIEIYEHPIKGVDGQIQSLRYIAGIDSYDADESTTSSLGSIFILDRFTDRIVAHFKGRPTANKFYETCRRMLKYYTATANYERSNRGIFGYFYGKHCLHLLCDEPRILKEKGISKASIAGNSSKGTAPSGIVNAWGRELGQTWMDSLAYGEETESEITNMDKIRSLGLLKEIIGYNQHDNFDDISSLGMLMIYREDLMVVKVNREERKKLITDDPFFKRHYPGKQLVTERGFNLLQNKW